MHLVITCIALTTLSVYGRISDRAKLKIDSKDYVNYDLELIQPSMKRRRIARKIHWNRMATMATHRQIEVILTEPPITSTTSEERKLRYNEKVYLPKAHAGDNSSSEIYQNVKKNNISVYLMSATGTYRKEKWTRVCFPLTGTAHPDGPLDYFEAIQAMRPPNFFPENEGNSASIKFFGETRYDVRGKKMKTEMQMFLRCLLSVISHVAEDSKRRRMARMLFTSMIGWLKDSLLVDLYSLDERPEDNIAVMEDIVEALIYMKRKHFIPTVAKDALKTYEFISVPGRDASENYWEQKQSFRVTTAVLITVSVAFVFVLVILGSCLAAAISSTAIGDMNQLPIDILPMDYETQVVGRSGQMESLTHYSTPQVAVPCGYEQQVQKLSNLSDSDLGSKVRHISMMAEQEQDLAERNTCPVR